MLTGFIMGTIAMSAIIYGKWAILLMLLVIIFFASKEYVKILEHKGFYPSLKVILFADIIFAAMAYFNCCNVIVPVPSFLSFPDINSSRPHENKLSQQPVNKNR